MHKADHSVVQPTYANVKKAIDKMDKPKIHPMFTENKFIYEKAMQDAEKMLAHSLIAQPGFEHSEVNSKTAPGLVMKKYGYLSKIAAIDSPKFKTRMESFWDPLFYNSPKKEFLPNAEINDDKIRTFKIPDLDFLIRQKYLYDNQNETFKRACSNAEFWCRYGFVKEYGGFHGLCTFLKMYYALYMGDVSGWDRCLSVMPEAYNLRNKYLKNKPWYYTWVTNHLVFSFEVDQDGYVFINHQGNRSGQGSTTIDNCICHVIVMCYALNYLYYKTYGSLPSYEQIRMQGINLMGDDNLAGITKEFSVPNFLELMREAYGHFGLIIKPGFDRFEKIEDILPDFEFLGQTIKFNQEFQHYVPQPRIGKVASSIIYADSKQDIIVYAQKIIGLCYICYAVEDLRKMLFKILRHLLTIPHVQNHTPTVEQIGQLIKDEKSLFSRIWGFE